MKIVAADKHARYRESHREVLRARARAAWHLRRSARQAANRKYRETHRAEVAARQRAYNARHREQRQAYNAMRAQRDRLGKLARDRAYYQAHKPQRRAQEASRAAAIRGAGGSFTWAEWQQRLEGFGHRCAYCGASGIPLTRDHVVPIARGGSNVIDNIVPACASCNRRKGTRTGDEFRCAR